MKLIIQIPCYNEAESLPETLLALPRHIDGIETIEYLIIDDGSKDDTSGVAARFGVHHIVRHRTNRGLAAAFQTGINKALKEGADIIVNTDADNQYDGRDIEKLVVPILNGKADIVVGDRSVGKNQHFGAFKQKLQVFGSFVVKGLSRTQITDAVSGFRAISRHAAQRIHIVSRFSYTTEMLIQAGRNRLSITSVPIRTNSVERPSRLFKSVPQFIMNQGITILRAYAMYNPLRVFMLAGGGLALLGLAPIVRFLYFFISGQGAGHIQSLVIGGSLLTLGTVAIMLGMIADLIGRNRQLLERTLEHVHLLEDEVMPIRPFQSFKAAKQTRAQGRMLFVYLAGTAICLLTLYYLFRFIAGNWAEISAYNFEMKHLPAILASAIIYGLGVVTTSLAWPLLLKSMGQKIALGQGLKIGLLAQAGKYIPGNVAHYFGRALIAKKMGISYLDSGQSTLYELLSAVIAAALIVLLCGVFHPPLLATLLEPFSALSFSWAPIAVLTLVLIILGLLYLRRPDAVKPFISFRFWILPVCALFVSFALVGWSFQILATALAFPVPINWFMASGLFAVAWLAGFVTPGAPAGLGVREFVLIAGLSGIVGPALAAIVTVSYRVLNSVVDAIMALIGAILIRADIQTRTPNEPAYNQLEAISHERNIS